jgi:anaerobic ribonucleoside-triphosphate reductase activating protein
MSEHLKLHLYHYEGCVSVLGPGKRAVLWFQGCPFRCDGCLVPQTHLEVGGYEFEISKLVDKIVNTQEIEGITLSGGEPFMQVEAMAELIKTLKVHKDLSIMIYSGYTLEELYALNSKKAEEVLKSCDILIDGQFKKEFQMSEPWRGSQNQKIHFLTSRYGVDDYLSSTANSLEYHIHSNGSIFQSGIPR